MLTSNEWKVVDKLLGAGLTLFIVVVVRISWRYPLDLLYGSDDWINCRGRDDMTVSCVIFIRQGAPLFC